eukprot:SAG31_NODE_2673_length_5268_cov_2.551944_4_plen_201_part_00
MVQIFRSKGLVSSFHDVLENIFAPLFEVTEDPSCDPKLHAFLQEISGFDSVDDESKADISMAVCGIRPAEWTQVDAPPYAYQIYFLWANISRLNRLRAAKGFNTFTLRPHCGEAGAKDHLATAYLLAHGINHGIMLWDSIVLQYLYYLDQVDTARRIFFVIEVLILVHGNRLDLQSVLRRIISCFLSTDAIRSILFSNEA